MKSIEDIQQEKEFDAFIQEAIKGSVDPGKVMVDYVGEKEMKRARESLVSI